MAELAAPRRRERRREPPSSTRPACASTSRTYAGSRRCGCPRPASATTGSIAEKLGELVEKDGGEIHLGRAVTGIARRRGRRRGPHRAAVTCSARRSSSAAGCAATSWPALAGADPGVRIVPFRGEYTGLLRPGRRRWSRGLIYPVPDPAFPFLGVHATRGVDGHVHAGPNAVLALAREGYSWGTVKPKELLGTLAYPGMLQGGAAALALRASARCTGRCRRRRWCARSSGCCPDVRAEDLHPAGAGVRAQAVKADGTLVDDFLFLDQGTRRRLGAARAERAVARGDRGAADRPGDPGAADRRAGSDPCDRLPHPRPRASGPGSPASSAARTPASRR